MDDYTISITDNDELENQLTRDDAIENVIALEPEITVQNVQILINDVCKTESTTDINVIQRQLLETGRNRDLADEYPLLEGKDAHFFVSYSSEDSARVLPIVAKLERQERVACVIHDRDFRSGMDIDENINRSMQRSMKMLLFLSKNFLESGYCNYERKMAFIMSMESGENKIIPVLLEECQVPSSLKPLTYIDVNAEDVVDRIMSAYSSAGSDVLPTDLDYFGPRKVENGYTISLPCEAEPFCPCRPHLMKTIMNEETRQQIRKGKLQVSEEVIQEAIAIINTYKTTGPWSRSRPRVYCCLVCCIWPIIVMTLLLLEGVIAWSEFSRQQSKTTAQFFSSFPTAFWTLTIVGIIFTFIAVAVYYEIQSAKTIRRMRADVSRKITLKTYKDGVLFKVTSSRSSCTIELIRYDIKPCQKRLALMIKQRRKENTGETNVETAEDYDIIADEIIRQRLDSLIYKSLPDAPEHRHYVTGGKMCLCQFLEAAL